MSAPRPVRLSSRRPLSSLPDPSIRRTLGILPWPCQPAPRHADPRSRTLDIEAREELATIIFFQPSPMLSSSPTLSSSPSHRRLKIPSTPPSDHRLDFINRIRRKPRPSPLDAVVCSMIPPSQELSCCLGCSCPRLGRHLVTLSSFLCSVRALSTPLELAPYVVLSLRALTRRHHPRFVARLAILAIHPPPSLPSATILAVAMLLSH